MSKKSEDKIIDHPTNNNLDTRVALLEQSISTINQTLVRVENRIERGFEKADSNFEKLDSKLSSRFFWLLGLYMGGYTSLLALIAKAVHWV